MNTIGIDFSTKSIDLVILREDDSALWFPCKLESWAPLEPARAAGLLLPPLIRILNGIELLGERVHLAVIEAPFSNSFKTCAALHEVRGAILGWLNNNVTVLSVSPQEWKREFCGDAAASKVAVADRVSSCVFYRGLAGIYNWPQDAFDAYGIAWAGREMCRRAAGSE